MKMIKIKSSLGVFLTILLSCTGVLSELCEITVGNSIKWRRHPDDCSSAYMCLLGQVVSYTCPDGYVIGSDEVTCVPAGSPLDDCTKLKSVDLKDVLVRSFKISPKCKEGETFADEENCAKYSECVTSPDGNTTVITQECAYPMLFDVKSGKCDHFKDVECSSGQTVPKSPCDYEAHQCSSAHCIPCNIRFPTCNGLPDGSNPWVGREWTPDYVICEQERVVVQNQCKGEKVQQVFHPDQKTCVEFDVKEIVG